MQASEHFFKNAHVQVRKNVVLRPGIDRRQGPVPGILVTGLVCKVRGMGRFGYDFQARGTLKQFRGCPVTKGEAQVDHWQVLTAEIDWPHLSFPLEVRPV